MAHDLAQSRESGLAQAPECERTQLTGRQRFVVAVTFFSMFFGAGILIFPPIVGALSGHAAVPALVGFTISAVGLPILGVIVVARAGGFAHLSARVSRASLIPSQHTHTDDPAHETPTVVAQDLAQSRESGLAQAPEFVRTQVTGIQRFVVAVTFF